MRIPNEDIKKIAAGINKGKIIPSIEIKDGADTVKVAKPKFDPDTGDKLDDVIINLSIEDLLESKAAAQAIKDEQTQVINKIDAILASVGR